MDCTKCGRPMAVIADGRILLTYASAHKNNINGKACSGSIVIAVKPQRVPPPGTVCSSLPTPCTGCHRSKMPMKYTGHSTPLYLSYCEYCDKDA